jgi:hypothetical protein
MELLSKRNLALTAAALVAAGALTSSCARPGSQEGANNSAAAPATAEAKPSIGVEPFASEPTEDPSAEASNSGTDENQQDTGRIETPINPLVFVVGRQSGETALFGCMRPDTTHLLTFGNDYIEGKLKGRAEVTAKGSKAIPNLTPGKLQTTAATHSDQLVTGPQKIGETTVDCGHALSADTQIFDTSGESVAVDDIQDYQVAIGQVDGSNTITVLDAAHA